MAIAFVAGRGTNNAKGTITTGSVTTTAAVASGNTLVLIVAGNMTSGGVPSLTVSGGSLTWTTQVNIYGASDQYSGIFTALAPSGLANGTVIDLTWASSIDAYAASLVEFSGLYAHTESADTVASGSSTTPSANLSAATDELVIGAIGIVGPSGDTFTQDTDTTNGSWSTITAAGTTGNPATGNATIRGAYKIVTGTGTQTYNPTLGSSRPWAESLVSLAAGPEEKSGSASQDTKTGSTQAGKKNAAASVDFKTDAATQGAGQKAATAPAFTVVTLVDETAAGRKNGASAVSVATDQAAAGSGRKNAAGVASDTTVLDGTGTGSEGAAGASSVSTLVTTATAGAKDTTSGPISVATDASAAVAGSKSAAGSAAAAAEAAAATTGRKNGFGAASADAVTDSNAAGEQQVLGSVSVVTVAVTSGAGAKATAGDAATSAAADVLVIGRKAAASAAASSAILSATGAGSEGSAGSATVNTIVAAAASGFATQPVTGIAAVLAPAGIIDARGAVAPSLLGRHALTFRRERRTAIGKVAAVGPVARSSSRGIVNDDELVFQLLEL